MKDKRTRISIPWSAIPREGMGVGDIIAAATKALGVKQCKGCEKRRQVLNRYIVQGTRRE